MAKRLAWAALIAAFFSAIHAEMAFCAARPVVGWAAAAACLGQKSKLDQEEEEAPPPKAPPKKDSTPKEEPAAKKESSPKEDSMPKKDSTPETKSPPDGKAKDAAKTQAKTPPEPGAPEKKAPAKGPPRGRAPEEEEEDAPPPKKRPSVPLEDPFKSSQTQDDDSMKDSAGKKGASDKSARKKPPVRRPAQGRGRTDEPKMGAEEGKDGPPEKRSGGGRTQRKPSLDQEEEMKSPPRDPSKPTVIDEEDKEESDAYDLLYLKESVRPVIRVQLLDEELNFSIPFRPGPKVKTDGRREFTVFPAGSGKRFLLYHEILRVEPYETRVVGQAADFLQLNAQKLVQPGNAAYVASSPVAERITKAETMLTRALAEHDSAVQRGLRADAGWNKRLRDPLVQARINLRLCLIDQLIRQNAPNAESDCDRLATEISPQHPGFEDLRQRADRIVAAKAQQALDRSDYDAVRDLLEGFAGRYPGRLGPEVQKIQDTLVQRATELVAEAEKLKATAPQKAMEQLELAAKIWPRLPGLDTARRTMGQDYPILRCAYPELPRTLCPLMARTAAERHAVSLVCESLVRWVDDPEIGSHYTAQLAQGLPQPLARGREFQLPKSRWQADAKPGASGAAGAEPTHWCKADDVRFTVKVLHDRRLAWYSPLYGDLLPQVEDASDGDPFSFSIYLAKDYWQPLALMDFKVLPSHCFSLDKQGADLAAELETFGRNPVGTGPFRLAQDADEGPNQRRFVANPYYRVAGQPHIREIVLQRLDPAPAVELFLQRKIDLIYALQPEHVNQLEQQNADVRTLQPPTVWFLAPNHRSDLTKNKNLRLAVAHGIDRESILRQYFRPGGRHAGDHKPLTGPFPPGSWASNPDLPPFSPARAKAYAEAARRELKRPQLILRLAYPAGSADVEKACQQMETQLKALDIALRLEKLEPEDFYRRVIDNRNFDLAYWSYTYPDVTYSLEPLLRPDQNDRDAVLRNAWNVMGYVPDADLESLFQQIHAHKQFREIQQLAHKIHEHVASEAILVPLWQLSVYVAVGDRLRNPTVTLDPLVLFAGAERWELESRP